MQNGQERPHLGWLLTLAASFAWFVCQLSSIDPGLDTSNLIKTGICVLCIGTICWRISAGVQRKIAGLNKGFGFYVEHFPHYSEKDIAKILILDTLGERGRDGQLPPSKQVFLRRLIISAVYIVLNFLLMNSLCTRSGATLWGSLLTLLWAWLFFRTNTLSVLASAAKKNPDMPITQVISRNTYDPGDAPNRKPVLIVGILVFALSIGGVMGLHWESRWTGKPVGNGYQITDYKAGITDTGFVTIPNTVDGKPVVSIGKRAFYKNPVLSSVKMPDTVVSIGEEAFRGCDNLWRLQLSQNLEEIGSWAFADCGRLNNVTLPETLHTLNGGSFLNCANLTGIVIPEKVTEIRGNTFEGCTRLAEVTLHEGIIDIHGYAFMGCTSLKAIALPSQITEIHAYTFENCRSLKAVEIPMGVTRIAAHAFYGCSKLEYVFVPDTVVEIGSSAFRLCDSLEEIALPENVAVDERAFKESPTQIQKKAMSDEILRQIQEECMNKEPAQTMYIMYDPAKPDDILFYDDRTVLVADSPRLDEVILNESIAIGAMDDAQMLEYLEKAKTVGVQNIVYGVYSEIGTQAMGSTYLLATTLTIDEGIAQMEASVAEAAHE